MLTGRNNSTSSSKTEENKNSHWKCKTGFNAHKKQVNITVHGRVPLTLIVLTVNVPSKHILI